MNEKTDPALTGDDSAPAMPVDPVELARGLIRCPSVTPEEGGAITLLEDMLKKFGFECHRLKFSEAGTPDVENLYARLGSEPPNVCFAGHTDVVPVGDPADWTVDPFAGEIVEDWLYGRGAVDMKGAIACWIAAVSRVIAGRGDNPRGSISLLVTGDEEGPSINGTRKVLEWLKARGERLDTCIVGEPTSENAICDTVKVGRRGSLNATLTVHGKQGHAAYPDKADNPVHRMVAALSRLLAEPLDKGSEHFQPSSLQVTSIDVANSATNVIPAKATARLNVRFNDRHSGASVEAWIRERVAAFADTFELDTPPASEPFLTEPGGLTRTISDEAANVLGRQPKLSTDGGTSDARFIKDVCPVVELGLPNAMAHQVDERVHVTDLGQMTDVYEAVLKRLLQAGCFRS